MAAAHVEPCGLINLRTQDRLRFLAVELAQFTVPIVGREIFGVLRQMASRPPVVRGDQESAFQLALPACESENELARLFTKRPQIARVLLTEPTFELRLIFAVAGMDLAAVASRCGRADVVCFKQHDPRAGIPQMKRS